METMTELGFEYKVMARRKSEKRWEPRTGIWTYQERMTLEKVKKFMYLRWNPKYIKPNCDPQLDYGIFRRMIYKKNGKIIREKWELIKTLKWAI